MSAELESLKATAEKDKSRADAEKESLQEKLDEANEKYYTAHDLALCKGRTEIEAANARAMSAISSLESALAKSKKLEDELSVVKGQLEIAKQRLDSVAGFQRQQMQLQHMLTSGSFLNLEDAAPGAQGQRGEAADGNDATQVD